MLINEFIGELLTWVAENGLNINDVHVSHGGTCMLLGLKESTDDIDLTVSAEIFEAYKAKSELFYARETAQLDKGESNIEDEN